MELYEVVIGSGKPEAESKAHITCVLEKERRGKARSRWIKMASPGYCAT